MVVAVGHCRTPAEQHVGLVKEQDPVTPTGRSEKGGEILLGLSDRLGNDDGKVDAIGIAPRTPSGLMP